MVGLRIYQYPCTYSNSYLLNRYCCLLASGYELNFVPAGCLELLTMDVRDSPKPVECHSKIK